MSWLDYDRTPGAWDDTTPMLTPAQASEEAKRAAALAAEADARAIEADGKASLAQGAAAVADDKAVAADGKAVLADQKASTFANYAAALAGVVALPSQVARVSATVSGRLIEWVRQTGGPCLGGGWAPSGAMTAAHMGFIGNGTMADTARVNAGLDWLGESGGGVLLIDVPGTYLLANTNPWPAAQYPGTTEAEANWWANRRAIWIRHDKVKLRLAAGVVLKIADGANCHAIQIGQFSLGIGVPQIAVSDSGVIGAGWQIDMNGANQTPATATLDHPAGVLVNHGARRIELSGGRIFGSSYYGAGFEGTNSDALRGFRGCVVQDMEIEDCAADGIDCKDFGTLSEANKMARVKVRNCGAGGGTFLSEQAGIDVRGGWSVEDCTVSFTDDYAGARVGFRGQYAPDFATSTFSTIFSKCRARTAGRITGTVGFRLSGRGAETDQCHAAGFAEGIRMSAPETRNLMPSLTDCGVGVRWFDDAGAGWNASTSRVLDGTISNCENAWRVDPGIANARVLGGSLSSIGVALVNNGSARIFGVQGFNTRATVLGTVAVGSTGLKSVTVAHGLPFTPTLADVQVHEQRGSTVSDYRLDFLRLVSVDAANVTLEAMVGVASATAGATTLARVTVTGLQ